ncbi:MAG: hypothetical protein V4819_15560 [Verrucomicrobiota bacterium]
MKLSIAVSLLILAAAASLGWHDHQRLTSVRESHAKLIAEAAQLGISVDPKNSADPVRVTKRERENREAEAKQAAADFIAFAKEMEVIEKKGGSPDEATQKKIMEFMDRMMSLDSAQLKILIAEVRAAKDLKDETRQGLIGFSIMTLSNDHPQAALALFTEASDIFEGEGMGKHVISSSLTKWAKDDPQAALEWVRKNGGKFPDLVDDDAKRGLLTGAAASDPKLAFSFIKELGLKNTAQAISAIVNVAKTPEERTATLKALGEHLATLTPDKARDDMVNGAVVSLSRNAAQEGFEAGSKWIESAGFTPDQLAALAGGGFSHSVKSEETGKWIEWMGKTLPADKADTGISNMVKNWTREDYQAAGKWLAATPDSPVKNVSVRAYADTVSRYDPVTAAQWAMTLPPGKERDDSLKNIHENWPKDDEAAKEAFANEHGIK